MKTDTDRKVSVGLTSFDMTSNPQSLFEISELGAENLKRQKHSSIALGGLQCKLDQAMFRNTPHFCHPTYDSFPRRVVSTGSFFGQADRLRIICIWTENSIRVLCIFYDAGFLSPLVFAYLSPDS